MFDLDVLTLTLSQVQEAVPPSPGEGIPTDGSTAAGGGGQKSSEPFGGQFFMLLLLVLGAMIIFTVMGQRRDRKKRQALLGSVKKHDRVQTSGGLIGSVVEVKADTIVLKVDESSNTRITFARSSIQQVLTSAEGGPAGGGDG